MSLEVDKLRAAPVLNQRACCPACMSDSLRPVQQGELCSACADHIRIETLESDNEQIAQHFIQSVDAHKRDIQVISGLQSTMAKLQESRYDSGITTKNLNSAWRKAERDCAVWKQHAARQKGQLQQIKLVISSLRERKKLDSNYCDSLLEIIDDSPTLAVTPACQLSPATTGAGIDLIGRTMNVLYRALSQMSYTVDPCQIKELCGSSDHGVFVDWMISQAEGAEYAVKPTNDTVS